MDPCQTCKKVIKHRHGVCPVGRKQQEIADTKQKQIDQQRRIEQQRQAQAEHDAKTERLERDRQKFSMLYPELAEYIQSLDQRIKELESTIAPEYEASLDTRVQYLEQEVNRIDNRFDNFVQTRRCDSYC